MTPVEVTGLISGLTALIATGLTPLVAKFVKNRRDSQLSMVQVAEMYQKEVVRLQERADAHDQEITQLRARHTEELNELKTRHAVAIAEVETKWRLLLDDEKRRTAELERQVENLYRRLTLLEPPR